jgi:hypothetical protein
LRPDGVTALIDKAAFDTPGDARPRPHPNCYWLLPGRVLAGEHPSRVAVEGLAALQAAGITHYIDLTSEHDHLPAYATGSAQRLSHPIVDFGVPTSPGMRTTLQAAEAALEAGGVLYLHCKAGIGRTGTVAACLLVDHGYTPSEALALLQRKWQSAGQRAFASETPETDAQRRFIAEWRAHPGAG